MSDSVDYDLLSDLAKETTLQAVGSVLASILSELGQKLETGQAVALDASTLAALESIQAAVSNFPNDYPDANTLAKLEAIRLLLAGTLAVSAAALPLPAGAATESKLEAVRALLAGTLAVSAASLPLPAGAATEATLAAALAALGVGIYNEDALHASGDKGCFILAIRRDSDTPTADDGDYTGLKTDEAGRLKVATQPASVTPVSGNITAIGGTVAIECKRFSNISVSMSTSSLAGHNVSFECSNNSTNGTDGTWYGVQAVRSNANTVETSSGVLAATPAYMWHINVGDYAWFRVRATAHTSGTAAYILRPGAFATEPIPGAQVTGTQPVSGGVTSTPATPTPSNITSAASTNPTAIKTSAGTLYNIAVTNTGAAAAYVKLYNKASAPTVGTDIPVLTIPVPAGGTVPVSFGALGHRFATGIALAITNLAPDTDATAVAAGQVKVLTSYI